MSSPLYFKTAQDEAAYFQAYRKVMDLWPGPFQPVSVATPFGSTHVTIAGPIDAPPVVLLHGRNATSAMWFPNVGCWQGRFRLYAIDTLGEPGKSRPNGTSPRNQEEYLRWLSSVLDGLGIQQADFVGHSYGAWLAVCFALAYPDRVGKIVLLEPAQTIQPFSIRFALWGVLLLLMPSRKLLQRFFRWESQGNTPHQDWIQLMILGISTFRAGKEVIASVLSNAELRRIQQPVLLLLGGRSVVQHVEHCRRRAMRYLAHLQVTVLPGASHNISLDDPEAVNGLVLDFL